MSRPLTMKQAGKAVRLALTKRGVMANGWWVHVGVVEYGLRLSFGVTNRAKRLVAQEEFVGLRPGSTDVPSRELLESVIEKLYVKLKGQELLEEGGYSGGHGGTETTIASGEGPC